MTPAQVAAAFRRACTEELLAPKPGNVHVHAPGHRMSAADFVRSAAAAAAPLCTPDAALGLRVLGAVQATRAAVGQNTNLGIVLLSAPLAMAALAGGTLRDGVHCALAASTLADADAVFRAIALAAPGGLGKAPKHDVRAPAGVRLPEAMAAAAPRDRIAWQYAHGFADVLGPLLAGYSAALARRGSRIWAAQAVYLLALATWPDSHVARRHDPAAAEAVRAEAKGWMARLDEADAPGALVPDLLAWDAELKARRINPGTSADLTVAAIFAHRLRNSLPWPEDDG